ncbi:hypothetical protein CCUS01_00221 [Colletotrichum cuscutae]|uniref:Uncharacterized protein n=1 Tax=Colletotrichum cuscutae TaxID=1209917 RepID=A0AAI9YE18_9PEZI|nr:hypothetical protein CCUS01_00221 [Colletotrichum cuscutae]
MRNSRGSRCSVAMWEQGGHDEQQSQVPNFVLLVTICYSKIRNGGHKGPGITHLGLGPFVRMMVSGSQLSYVEGESCFSAATTAARTPDARRRAANGKREKLTDSKGIWLFQFPSCQLLALVDMYAWAYSIIEGIESEMRVSVYPNSRSIQRSLKSPKKPCPREPPDSASWTPLNSKRIDPANPPLRSRLCPGPRIAQTGNPAHTISPGPSSAPIVPGLRSSLIHQQNIRDVGVGKSQFSFQYPKVWTSGEQGRMTTSRYKPRAEASRDPAAGTPFPLGGQRDGRWEYVITNTKPAEIMPRMRAAANANGAETRLSDNPGFHACPRGNWPEFPNRTHPVNTGEGSWAMVRWERDYNQQIHTNLPLDYIVVWSVIQGVMRCERGLYQRAERSSYLKPARLLTFSYSMIHWSPLDSLMAYAASLSFPAVGAPSGTAIRVPTAFWAEPSLPSPDVFDPLANQASGCDTPRPLAPTRWLQFAASIRAGFSNLECCCGLGYEACMACLFTQQLVELRTYSNTHKAQSMRSTRNYKSTSPMSTEMRLHDDELVIILVKLANCQKSEAILNMKSFGKFNLTLDYMCK